MDEEQYTQPAQENPETPVENSTENLEEQRAKQLQEIIDQKAKQQKKMAIGIGVFFAILLIGGLFFNSIVGTDSNSSESTQIETTVTETVVEAEYSDDHDHVDYTKLPLGDGMYSGASKKGYVYACNTTFNGGGADTYGPWINEEKGTWNLDKKISVDGDVSWPQASWINNTTDELRFLESKDLPTIHNTGIYPISSTDDAYQYDKNPNSIAEQELDFSVPRNPEQLEEPDCIGGEVGIATTGVLIFSAFDAAGRDAVAVEVQDKCQGHPQQGGYYHYHGYSSCFEDESVEGQHSDLLGYAFDGFGIFGLKGEAGIELTSDDLDVCHGHAHEIGWEGELVEMYHYHMTQDFPYTVSCFRGEPSIKALSMGEGGESQGRPSQPVPNSGPRP